MQERNYGESDIIFRETFAKRLKLIRLESKLTLKALTNGLSDSFDINITNGAISNYENGRRLPDAFLLSKIADFLDTTTDYLLGKTDIRNGNLIEMVIYDELGKPNLIKLTVKNKSRFLKMTQLEVQEYITSLKGKKNPFDKNS